MRWIGLKDHRNRRFCASGIDAAFGGETNPDVALAQGSILVEFQTDPQVGVQTVFEYGASFPWSTGFIINWHGAGILTIEHWVGRQRHVEEIQTGLTAANENLLLTYIWDGPAREAVIAIDGPLRPNPIVRHLKNPMPLCYRDLQRMIDDDCHARIGEKTAFIGLARGHCPIGPLPSLAGNTPIPTSGGMRSVSSLRQGQHVVTKSGQLAQVRWAGSITMPARGRFAPMTVRAPYFGLTTDITVASSQKLRLKGAAIDYMFDTDSVSALAGDLFGGHAVQVARSRSTQTYYHFLLDTIEPTEIAGLTMSGINANACFDRPELLRHSVFADLPRELLPRMTAHQVRTLMPFEAESLRRHLAA